MDREIKFRARMYQKSKWLYGYIAKDDEDCSILNNKDNCFYFVDEETVGQFTGLKDKNGVEIYEEDIVKRKDKIYIVIYSWGAFRLIPIYDYNEYIDYKKQGSEFANWLFRAMTRKFIRDSEKFEVIGNIYENPELLKVGEE